MRNLMEYGKYGDFCLYEHTYLEYFDLFPQ